MNALGKLSSWMSELSSVISKTLSKKDQKFELFPHLPSDVKKIIVNSISLSKRYQTEVTDDIENILNLSLVNKELNGLCSTQLYKIKMIAKYNTYNASSLHYSRVGLELSVRFNFPLRHESHNRVPDYYLKNHVRGNSQLYVALARGTQDDYVAIPTNFTYETEVDIRALIKCDPESINFINGSMRTTQLVRLTPIFIACYNKNVPTSLVELLLASGADPHETLEESMCNGNHVNHKRSAWTTIKPYVTQSVLLKLEKLIEPERYEIIFELFKKYGLDPWNPIFEGSENARIEALKVLNSADSAAAE